MGQDFLGGEGQWQLGFLLGGPNGRRCTRVGQLKGWVLSMWFLLKAWRSPHETWQVVGIILSWGAVPTSGVLIHLRYLLLRLYEDYSQGYLPRVHFGRLCVVQSTMTIAIAGDFPPPPPPTWCQA